MSIAFYSQNDEDSESHSDSNSITYHLKSFPTSLSAFFPADDYCFILTNRECEIKGLLRQGMPHMYNLRVLRLDLVIS